MPEKSSILADRFGKLILTEMRGISFEVRTWAEIIKNVVDQEYKKYWDDHMARMRSSSSYMRPYRRNSMFFGDTSGTDYSYSGEDDDYFYGDYNFNGSYNYQTQKPKTKTKITANDLAFMDVTEINEIINTVMTFHNLKYENFIDMKSDEIVKLYNQAIEQQEPEVVEPPVAEQPKEELPKVEETPPIPQPTQIIINGKDYPEAYEKFSVDKWVISDQQPTEYDHLKSGYQENGEYTVFINCVLSSISSYVLIHEIKHAYQDWQRISTNHPPLKQSKELQQLYTKDFERFILSHRGGYNLDSLDSVISAYYMSSNAEITAYLESEYDDIMGKSSGVQSGGLYNLAQRMLKFDTNNVERYTKPKKLQNRWTEIITDYDIPLFRKFKNVFDFLKYTEKLFNKKGKYIINKIDKLKTMELPKSDQPST